MTKEKQCFMKKKKIFPTNQKDAGKLRKKIPQRKSSIVKGVPKVTKPAPPVVAIKMADLISDTPENEPVEQSKSCEESHLDNVKDTKPPVEDKKLKKELEKKERKEKE